MTPVKAIHSDPKTHTQQRHEPFEAAKARRRR
jgi:hypothetical protein